MQKYLFAILLTASPLLAADDAPLARPARANYELASKWTPAKVAKLVFDTAVSPHWLEQGDRFWYTFENSEGRKFWMVDPARKSKTSIFDPVKMASQLTAATGLPFDSQHLPMCQPPPAGAGAGAGRGGEGPGMGGAAPCLRFVKSDAAIQFEITVPRDAVIPGEKPPSAGGQQQTAAQQQPP